MLGIGYRVFFAPPSEYPIPDILLSQRDRFGRTSTMPITMPQINETSVKMMVESMSMMVLLGGMLRVP